MKANLNYGLQGAFQVNLYSGKDRQLVSGTEFFSNYITPVGLLYPTRYAFADCFRYLSIGSSNGANSGTDSLSSSGTTGLETKINSYVTDSGSQSGQYIGWRAYVTGQAGDLSSCGTLLTEDGLRLFRTWSVPSGGALVNEGVGGLDIQEFMVSPGTGAGFTGGGLAFSRVTRSIYIPNGMSADVSYQLKLTMQNTGLTDFDAGTFTTGNADVTDGLAEGWANLSGYYRQIIPAFRFVDTIGMTYIPKFGDGMEPKTNSTKGLCFYLSPDNAQFAVSSTTARNTGSEADAYAADGVHEYIGGVNMPSPIVAYGNVTDSYLKVAFVNDSPSVATTHPNISSPSNLRLGKTTAKLYTPNLGDYTADNTAGSSFNYQTTQTVTDDSISIATPGVNGWDSNIVNYGQKAVFSSSTINLPFATGGSNAITGRTKTLTRRATFPPFQSMGYNTRFGSLVYAYQVQESAVAGARTYYPMIDTLFYDSSGKSLPQHYRLITGLYLSERGSGVCAATAYLAAQSGDNIYKFAPMNCYFGPSGGLTHGLDSVMVGGHNTGARMLGPLNDSVGVTGLTTGAGHTGYGYGMAYGLLPSSPATWWDLRADLGLTSSFTGNVVPEGTGEVYWPSAVGGQEIQLNFSGIKFYNQYLKESGLVVSGLTFNGAGKTFIEKISFSGASVLAGTNSIFSTFPTLISETPIQDGQFPETSYGVQTYNNVSGCVLLLADDAPHLGSNISGIYWTGTTSPPNDIISFPITVSYELDAWGTGRHVVKSFPSGLENRGINNVSLNPEVKFFLSGTGVAGTRLYLASAWDTFNYLDDAYNPTGEGFWVSTDISGRVDLGYLCPPSGRAFHVESTGSAGGRLLPNYSTGNYYGSNVYTPIVGGRYPALSLDNGLDIYLDISWSATGP